MKPEQERVKTVLIDTVALLCKNGLPYERELRIQAVIGVSVDENDVFIVHINESFSPQGASSTSSSAAAETSMALVPFSADDHQPKREFEAPRTPSSGVKRMRAETGSPMSPSADLARQYARQQLRFPSPAKSPMSASVPRMSVRAPAGASTVQQHSGGMPRGSAAGRGTGRGARRPGMGRGFAAGRSPRGLGSTRGASRAAARGGMRARGPRPSHAAYMPSQPNQPDRRTSAPGSFDVKFSMNEPPAPRITTPADSSAGFNFSAYRPPATATYTPGATGVDDSSNPGMSLPSFSSSDHDQFANTVPPGFGFDGVFPADMGGVQPGSFADINPTLDYGFPTSFSASNVAGFAGSGQSVSSSTVKSESVDDDVIFVEDDPVSGVGNSSGSMSTAAGEESGVFEGSAEDDGSGVPGAAVQQITRRVTITTNIQGQNVKYEQVQHAVATLPGPVVPTNSAIDSTASPTASTTFSPYLSDPSVLNNAYQQNPVYDYPGGLTSPGPTGADVKPGWDVLSGVPGSASYPGSTLSSPAFPQGPPPPRQMMPRGSTGAPRAKRMVSPRSHVTTHLPAGMRAATSPCLSSLDPGHAGAPGPVRHPGQRGAGTPSKKHTVGGLPLSDVGLGGGRAEDGTAWSMVARFVCSVPGCGASFTRKQNLLRHQTQKHGRPKAPRSATAGGTADDYDDDDLDCDEAMLPTFYQ